MNTLVQNEFNILHETQNIRGELMDTLSDADLAYKLPGDNPTLGELCVEMGQVERSYIDSFRTLKQNWSYAAVDPSLKGSGARLKAWYQELDAELDAVLSGLDEQVVQTGIIERGFPAPVRVQFHIYREALLIFYGKAACYLKAIQRPVPKQMSEWMG
jgi:uncharacterized damage-inducible protein DinB